VHTTDGGATWTSQSSETTSNLWGLSFVNATTGIAVGDGRTILSTDDGGDTWMLQQSGTTNILRAVSFLQ